MFIQGPSGCGKSALIRQALGPAIYRAGSFHVQRLMRGNQVSAFRLLPAGDPAPQRMDEVGLEGVFFRFHGDQTQRHMEVFETIGVELLQAIPGHAFALIDGIGGFEMRSALFCKELRRVMDSAVPTIGVYKSEAGFGNMDLRLNLTPDYMRASVAFGKVPEKHPKVDFEQLQ